MEEVEVMNEPEIQPDDAVEQTGVQEWDEDFDVDAEPTEEVVEESVESDEPEYITKGLGKLDKPIVLKNKGRHFDIDDLDQLRDLAEKGADYTLKMQELKKERDLLHSDEHLPEPETNDEVEAISQSILDSEIVDDFRAVVDILPDSEIQRLSTDARLLSGLKVDIESGFTQKILPQVDRYMTLEGLSFEEAYFKAGSDLTGREADREAKVAKLHSEPSRTTSTVTEQSKDIWDLSDAEYDSLISTQR